MSKHRIGILAYGSLIDEPGLEIEQLIIHRINCLTPFKVEYARKSGTRGDGPTLIPTEKMMWVLQTIFGLFCTFK